MKKGFLLGVFIIFTGKLCAQQYHQTVRGKVIDKESHNPIEFASVTIFNDNYSTGTITDGEGEFVIETVPVGRKSVAVSFVGYETVHILNLEVTMGKETIVNVEMAESSIEIAEVEVKAFTDKEDPINSYAPISARTFSIEESKRYAGAFNDVSRMAMNFAGAKQSVETFNEIIIRGNSPANVLFRLEGVDIPNPNHYGDGGTTGGTMSMLNNNILANSDFITGAFPAEYANTISGVFDLNMRNGNNKKHEFIGQTGLIGVEFGAEGPLKKERKSSYLINYRYTNYALMEFFGMDLMGNAKFNYQDLTFKLHFPSRKLGNLSVFGLGGKSFIKMFDSERDTALERQQMAYDSDFEINILNENYMGVVGVTHSYLLGSKAYTKLILSATTIMNYNRYDSLSTINRNPILKYYSDFTRTQYAARFFLNKKFDSKKSIRAGVYAEVKYFSLLDSIYDAGYSAYRKMRDYNGNHILPHLYVQYKHKLQDDFKVIAGVNAYMQAKTNYYSFEPRLGLKWEFFPGHTLSFGYGLHSEVPPIEIRQKKVMRHDGMYIQPNRNLNFTKSHHLVLGYDHIFVNKIRLKAEGYYQHIFDALVEKEPGSYSLLNRGSYDVSTFEAMANDVRPLSNNGTGYNYGLELTVERFMDRGMYFLSTLSLYESKYKGSDGILRDNAFCGNYVFNLLGGKEFHIGRQKEHARYIKKLALDAKLNWSGGQRYTPINIQASREAGTTVLDHSQAFAKQLPDYFRVDFRIGFKWMGSHSTQEIAIDIQNLTNRENPFYIKYSSETGNIETKGFGMMPQLLYRISF
ncbi:MAG: TonB-dependent receptor [Bacteroidota bacterium]